MSRGFSRVQTIFGLRINQIWSLEFVELMNTNRLGSFPRSYYSWLGTYKV